MLSVRFEPAHIIHLSEDDLLAHFDRKIFQVSALLRSELPDQLRERENVRKKIGMRGENSLDSFLPFWYGADNFNVGSQGDNLVEKIAGALIIIDDDRSRWDARAHLYEHSGELLYKYPCIPV